MDQVLPPRVCQNKRLAEYIVQWNPSKVDNLEPHILSITVGCPLWRGCIDVNGKTIGTQKFVRYIEVSIIEGYPLSGVPFCNKI